MGCRERGHRGCAALASNAPLKGTATSRRRLVCDTATGLWNAASETSYYLSKAVFYAHASGGANRAP